MKKWKESARDFYERNYYSKNDDGHKIDHADMVYKNMQDISIKLGLGLKDDIMFMSAYTHDLFSHTNRDAHHIFARDYVLNACDEYLRLFSKDEILLISQAVHEHRSSGSCKYSNDYSLAIQIADKGKPNMESMILRSFYYHRNTQTQLAATEEVVSHMKDKFGYDGYGFKCEFYKSYYRKEIKEIQDRIATLDTDEVWEVIKKKGVRNA